MRNLTPARRFILSTVAGLTMLTLCFQAHLNLAQAANAPFSTLPGSAASWTVGAQLLSPHRSSDHLTIALLLKTSHPEQQKSLLASLYHTNNPSYHHWLSTGEFARLFAPEASTVAAAQHFLTGAGLQLQTSPDATMLLATGTFGQVAAAFHSSMNDYRLPNGKVFYGNPSDVQVPSQVSQAVLGVFGLSDFVSVSPNDVIESNFPHAPPAPYGGGPLGSGLTPSQIAGIYDSAPVYNTLTDRGQGISMALFELARYKASDITKYEDHYGLRHVPLINKLVLGGATSDNGAAEVELDIELQIAMAPGATNVQVYDAPNTELGTLAEYLQIAKDNTSDVMSTSWSFFCEYGTNSQIPPAENQIFLQMAAQGQSTLVAAGDAGAFGCTRGGLILPLPEALQIGDPTNQPYVTVVGGTSFRKSHHGPILFDPGKNAHPTYPGPSAEGTWLTACTLNACEGGAGGVSRIWAEPDYAFNPNTGQPDPGVVESAYSQNGAYCGQQPGVMCRESPDVSLDSDPSTGYSIYCTDVKDAFCAHGEFTDKPGWLRIGGTSCAAPVWAGIAALDDAHHQGRLGLLNYNLYTFDSPSGYASQLHDITLFNNGFYPAGPAYDLATGLGTPDIYNLIKS